MPSNRSRQHDDEDDDRPRRRRQDDDDDDEPPRKRRRRDEDDEAPPGGKAGIIIAAVLGLLAVAVIAITVVATRKTRGPGDPPTAGESADGTAPDGRRPQVGGTTPGVDAEGLPIGNDLDSVLVRLNQRFRQNDFFRYQLEVENLRLLKKPEFARGPEVFRTLRAHAGTPAAQPQVGTIPFLAWQQAMTWATKDEVPELCKMLTVERVEPRQSDLFGKLAAFKDPRCAEAVAPFLASPQRRNAAETLLKELDSTAERFVLPYLGAGNAAETRVAALQVVSAVGTRESVKFVEPMTRDPDPTVNHHAKIVFEKMSKDFGVELDLLAVVQALKDGIVAQNPAAINDADQQLTKAYRPDHPKRAEVFKALIECCKLKDAKNNYSLGGFNPALKWSSKDDVETLCQLLVFSGGEYVVFRKLKEYKDPKSADTVAAFLTVPLKTGEAAAVLKEIGAGAERAVLPYAMRAAPNGAAIPFGTRLAAIDLLGDIGAADSVPVLRQGTADPTVQAAANKALAKVLARAKK
jgi:hypothetical protein